MENGVQISTCAAITVQFPRLRSSTCRSTISRLTATMISGSTSGSMMKPMTPALPGNRAIAPDRAAQMPSRVDKMAVQAAMTSELRTAPCSAVLVHNSPNQRVVNP